MDSDTTGQSSSGENVGAKSKDRTDSQILTFNDRDYLLYEGRILEDLEADQIFNHYKNLGRAANEWKSDETMLLQWSVFSIAIQKGKNVDEFDEQDWATVSQFVPTKSD